MTRNLKALGVAFVAILAMLTVAASAAHATPADFKVDETATAEITVEADPTAKIQLFKAKVGNISCDEFHATAKGEAVRSEVTLENIKYGKCTLGGIAATVNFNAGAVPCHYTITSGDTVETGKSTGDITLGPANCTVKLELVLAKCSVSVSGEQSFEDRSHTKTFRHPENERKSQAT